MISFLPSFLKFTPNLEKLTIHEDCNGPCIYVLPPAKRLTLSKLKSLKIQHVAPMNYQIALEQILIAAFDLEKLKLKSQGNG